MVDENLFESGIVEIRAVVCAHVLHTSSSTGSPLAHYCFEKPIEYGRDLFERFEQPGPFSARGIIDDEEEIPVT